MNLSALTETGPTCVHFASVQEVAAFLEHPCDLAVFHLRGAELGSEAQVFSRVARAMGFPAWFEHHRDALGDGLRDLAWHPAHGYLLIVWDAEEASARALEVLRHSWECSAPSWHVPSDHDEFGPLHPTPFHLVLVGQESRVFSDPAGEG
ncbi:barstar family protein [Deinococcus aestuarii]|uniref:barstar family protein n=1 Tax=Deinococcus aestuarii TaxID=2774531 RepID=UPI001C0B9ADE|nr:barstar family protein [Deinococcus aestuarii]